MALVRKLGLRALNEKVSWGALAIVAICMVDLLLTLAAVLSGKAIEANPLLAWTFGYGAWAFAAVKVLSFVPGVWALEACRLHNAVFAGWAARLGVYGYIAVYLFGSLRIHGMLAL